MKAIFLDGFKKEYLQHTPYLQKLSKTCIHGELEVPFGYTSIIASFVTGCHPNKHGIIDVFEKREGKKLFSIPNKLLVNGWRYLTNNLYLYSPLQKNSRYFKPSMKKIWMQKNCLALPTLFDHLEDHGKNFQAVDWPFTFNNRQGNIFFKQDGKTVMKHAQHLTADFQLIHFPDLDTLGHIYGPESKEMKEKLKEIDAYCEQLADKDTVYFSDHGMDLITQQYDLEKELNETGLTYGKDYLAFIASTYAQFWFYTPEARNKITALLESLDEGTIIDQNTYKLPKKQHAIFLAKQGTVFSPSYFTKKIDYKAMHGWDPKKQLSFYMITRPGKEKKAHMVDLLPTILDMMQLPTMQTDGKSLLK
ncbi:MAG: alkaline phosphatase family protein [Nanoarchaeota archaeon]|nr:alkaline phosphatase family protein [Nanoarchaeota archaeon]